MDKGNLRKELVELDITCICLSIKNDYEISHFYVLQKPIGAKVGKTSDLGGCPIIV